MLKKRAIHLTRDSYFTLVISISLKDMISKICSTKTAELTTNFKH